MKLKIHVKSLINDIIVQEHLCACVFLKHSNVFLNIFLQNINYDIGKLSVIPILEPIIIKERYVSYIIPFIES